MSDRRGAPRSGRFRSALSARVAPPGGEEPLPWPEDAQAWPRPQRSPRPSPSACPFPGLSHLSIGAEPKLARQRTNAPLCASRSVVFIQSLTRIDCCHVRPFAQAMTEEEQMTKDKDQKNRGSKARTKTNTKSADHILYGPARVIDSKKAQLHQKTAVAPGCVDASGGAAILSYPRVILELSLSYP